MQVVFLLLPKKKFSFTTISSQFINVEQIIQLNLLVTESWMGFLSNN